MRLDVFGDNEFHPGQSHAVIGQEAGFKGQFGIADIEHDFGFRPLQIGQIGAFDVEVEQAGIDLADIALGAGYGDRAVVLDQGSGIVAADHGRDAQFAGDYRRMAGAPAAVGD